MISLTLPKKSRIGHTVDAGVRSRTAAAVNVNTRFNEKQLELLRDYVNTSTAIMAYLLDSKVADEGADKKERRDDDESEDDYQ